MSRTLQITASFVIVLAAYGAYSFVAVPLVEPSIDPAQREQVSAEAIRRVESSSRRRADEWAWLFAPGSRELDNPKILQSDQVTLLVGQYTTEPDGQVRLWPCTIVLTPGSPDAPPDERRRRTVVLQAPGGALLRFDEALDLGRARIGRLIGGQVPGEITIRGEGRPNDPSDDLLVITRQVRLSQKEISTSEPVEFRFGPHHGRGRQMRIGLLPAEGTAGGRGGPQIAGLESFELAQLDGLHLELPEKDLSSRGLAGVGAASPAAAGRSKPSPGAPVDVTCRGPLVFDMPRREATLVGQVSVLRGYPDGPADSLHCDKLTVQFTQKVAESRPKPSVSNSASFERVPLSKPLPPASPKAEESSKPPGLLDLEPARLLAEGRPVVLLSPREQAEVRGERLDYNLKTGRIMLDGKEPVSLCRGASQCQAVYIEYQPPAPGRAVGQIAAAGPGMFRGQLDDRPGQILEARWQSELRLQPDKQNPRGHVLSLTGGAAIDYGAIGHLEGGEIHFFASELPPEGQSNRPRLAPERMQADGNVKLNSPQLTVAVDQLQAWFKPDPAAPGGYQTRIESSPAGGSAAGQAPGGVGTVHPNAPRPDVPDPLAAAAPENHLQLTGRLLQVEIALEGAKARVANLRVYDQVHLIETRTKSPDEKPIDVQGDWIEVKDASAPHATARILGRPARFLGRGLGLCGGDINLNRGTNRLWIDGPGSMDLPPMDRDLQGRPVTGGGPLRVDWRGRMDFDGRTARFEQSVVAASAFQQLRTEVLEASFRQVIRFAEADTRNPPELERLRCDGGVRMDSRSFDGTELASVEGIETQDLSINNLSGELAAKGPGWLTSVRRGASPLAGFPGLRSPGGAAGGPGATAGLSSSAENTVEQASPGAPRPLQDELNYLRVQFQGSITGNVHQREITFNNRVQAVYGPIPTWESTLPEDDPDALGDRGARLACEHLSVVEMPSPTGDGRGWAELAARGNAKIEGRLFTAWGHQVQFDQRKGLLILKGDGRTDAFVTYQDRVNHEVTITGQEFSYWPATQKSSGGLRSLEVDQFSSAGESRW